VIEQAARAYSLVAAFFVFGAAFAVALGAAFAVVWTAGAGDWVAFRYAVLYNDTPSSPADPLLGYWDYGSALTLGNGETFTLDFGASIFTLA